MDSVLSLAVRSSKFEVPSSGAEGAWRRVPPQRAVSRILSAFATLRSLRRDDHSSRPGIADGLERPTRRPRTGRPFPARAAFAGAGSTSLFGLAPCGVLPAICLTADAVRSYRTFSPLPAVAGKDLGCRCKRMIAFQRPPRRKRHPRSFPATAGGIFSVPLSFGLPRPGVTRRTALRSSDFPPRVRSSRSYGAAII
jgi:hypothetical protein